MFIVILEFDKAIDSELIQDIVKNVLEDPTFCLYKAKIRYFDE